LRRVHLPLCFLNLRKRYPAKIPMLTTATITITTAIPMLELEPPEEPPFTAAVGVAADVNVKGTVVDATETSCSHALNTFAIGINSGRQRQINPSAVPGVPSQNVVTVSQPSVPKSHREYVGATVGVAVGAYVGADGVLDGATVGGVVGSEVGTIVGAVDNRVGCAVVGTAVVGLKVVGAVVGAYVGADGVLDGATVGGVVGSEVGTTVGAVDNSVGCAVVGTAVVGLKVVGTVVGAYVGADGVLDGATVGGMVGVSVEVKAGWRVVGAVGRADVGSGTGDVVNGVGADGADV
jgi:hypothetical protein